MRGFALHRDQDMPGLGAEMRQINCRHRIGGRHPQHLTGRKCRQAFARPQNGQRADKPFAICRIIPLHRFGPIAYLAMMPARIVQRKCDGLKRDVGPGLGYASGMFGIDLIDAALLPAMMIAVVAGILSFLSPCVLPIVPPYLAYMSGISMGDMRSGRSPLLAAVFFVLGLSTVFMLLGFTASAFGAFFLTNADWFAAMAGVIVMVFGAHFLGVIRIGFLNRELRMDAGNKGGSAFGAYVLGLAFAFGWTPCIGPQLGAILSLAAQEGSVVRGTTLLGVYALGLGIPFLLVAAFFPRMGPLMAFFKRHTEQIERIMGLLLWTVGLLMLTGGFSQFSYWLLENVPFLANLG
jgi:cytochrome c-type biogenesis protein